MTIVKKDKKNKSTDAIEEIYKQDIQAPTIIKNRTGFKIIIVCLIISFLSGFIGAWLKDALIGQSIITYAPTAAQPNTETEILDLEFLLSKEDQQYNKVLSELKGQLVGFYKKRSGQGILDSIYLQKDFLGSGIIVTSDGWLLTHSQVVGNEDYVVITADKKVLEPLKEVADDFTKTVLVQVSAKDLTPVKFADLNYLQVTDPLLTVRYSAQNHGSDIVLTSIQRFAYHDQVKPTDFLLSTEKIDHYLKVTDDFDLVYNGAAVFNNQSEVVGLLFKSGREEIRLAVPGYYLKSAVSNFLSSSAEVIRSSLGVYYVDLSESLGLPEEVAGGRLKGAVLLGDLDANVMAVAEGSSAAEAGLEAGDIILKVNNEEINEKNSLTKLIQDYTPGQELTLLVFRAGEELEIKAVLGEI
ncbi:S1C family serine protease [Patescibacteria group bacterium]|nr:S1C family serine protease [Patescibacteria group bacterium]